MLNLKIRKKEMIHISCESSLLAGMIHIKCETSFNLELRALQTKQPPVMSTLDEKNPYNAG